MPKIKNNEEKSNLKPITSYITKEKKEQLQKLARAKKKTDAELIRESIDLMLNIKWYEQNVDEVASKILSRLEPFIQAQINRSIACTMNSVKASATSTYMIAYFLDSFVPEERQRNYRQLLFRCNEMAKEFSGMKGSNIGVLDRLKIDDELFLSANNMDNEEIEAIIEKYQQILENRRDK